MDPYYYMLAFMFAFVSVVLFLMTRSAGKIAKEREVEAAALAAAGGDNNAMAGTRMRRARREE